MRYLHLIMALSIGLLSCGQLQAAFHLLENVGPGNTPTFPVAPSPQANLLGVGSGTALEYGMVFQVKATVPNPLPVNALGFFDANHDGLAEPNGHIVELFQLVSAVPDPSDPSTIIRTFSLISKTTVPTGTGGSLDGDFRYSSIAPVSLTAGTSYLLLASVGTLVSDPPGLSPLDKFATLTQNVANVADNGPLNDNFVPGNNGSFSGLGTAKTLKDTSSYGLGDQLISPYNPSDPTKSTTTIVQPGENFPYLVNLRFDTTAGVPEPGSIVVWTVLGALGLVRARKYLWNDQLIS